MITKHIYIKKKEKSKNGKGDLRLLIKFEKRDLGPSSLMKLNKSVHEILYVFVFCFCLGGMYGVINPPSKLIVKMLPIFGTAPTAEVAMLVIVVVVIVMLGRQKAELERLEGQSQQELQDTQELQRHTLVSY